jgi:hypothetical protein
MNEFYELDLKKVRQEDMDLVQKILSESRNFEVVITGSSTYIMLAGIELYQGSRLDSMGIREMLRLGEYCILANDGKLKIVFPYHPSEKPYLNRQ